MNTITTTSVDVYASTISRVPATPALAGVINADPRLRNAGEVCLLTLGAQLQGTTLSALVPATGTRVMGDADFDKYRTGSHAIGLTG